MKTPSLSSETVHASCVAVGGAAVLIAGRSGRGKSDLALRLMDRGHQLVSDDYTLVRRRDGKLLASPPETIAGKIEVRGVGIVERPCVGDVQVALVIDLDLEPTRMPDAGEQRLIAGVAIPAVGLAALEASAPLKVEAALALLGLKS